MTGLNGGFVGAGVVCLVIGGMLWHASWQCRKPEHKAQWLWRVRWGSAALIAGGFLTGLGATG